MAAVHHNTESQPTLTRRWAALLKAEDDTRAPPVVTSSFAVALAAIACCVLSCDVLLVTSAAAADAGGSARLCNHLLCEYVERPDVADDPDVERAIDAHWDSLALLSAAAAADSSEAGVQTYSGPVSFRRRASTPPPAELREVGVVSAGIEDRMLLASGAFRASNVCGELHFRVRLARARSVRDNVSRKILNSRRFVQFEDLLLCAAPNDDEGAGPQPCHGVHSGRGREAVCEQRLSSRRMIAYDPATNTTELDAFWIPDGCFCRVIVSTSGAGRAGA